MARFLLDENLSHETATYLRELGHSANTVAQFGLSGVSDIHIARKAVEDQLVIVTFDLDFGAMYYFGTDDRLCVIVLRIRDQTVESVNRELRRISNSGILEQEAFRDALIIVSETNIRIRRK